MSERLLLTGNHAAGYAAMLSRVEVISAYEGLTIAFDAVDGAVAGLPVVDPVPT